MGDGDNKNSYGLKYNDLIRRHVILCKLYGMVMQYIRI